MLAGTLWNMGSSPVCSLYHLIFLTYFFLGFALTKAGAHEVPDVSHGNWRLTRYHCRWRHQLRF